MEYSVWHFKVRRQNRAWKIKSQIALYFIHNTNTYEHVSNYMQVLFQSLKSKNTTWTEHFTIKRYTSCGVQVLVHVHEFPHLGLLPIVISKFRPPILSINVKNSSYSMTIIEKLMPKGDLKLDTFIKKNTENCQHWVLAINIIKKYDAQFLS